MRAFHEHVAATCELRRRLVHDRPEQPDLADGLQELVVRHGLHDVPVHAEVVAAHHVLLLGRRGDHHDRQRLELRLGADQVHDVMHRAVNRRLDCRSDDN